MLISNPRNGWILALAMALVVTGCTSKPADDAGTDTGSTTATKEEPKEAEVVEPETTEEPETAAEEPEAEPEATPEEEPEPAAEPEKNEAKAETSNKGPALVAIPTYESPLTAGIPGDGPLTNEEIKAWLDDPQNHEEIDFQLPLGLASAQAAIKGVKENPLTKAKIELGRQLYFDNRLSADATISCASCHHPNEGYARHTRFGVGINAQEGGRNSPVSFNRILSDKQFWDGRAETLEAQAVGPIENPIEMGNTHDVAVQTIKGIDGYVMQFEKIFGEEGVTIDNIGKAIAAFERVIVTGPSPYDYAENAKRFADIEEDELEEYKTDDPEFYAEIQQAKKDAAENPMSESAMRGWELFFDEKKTDCKACHAGANFTDEQYHNLGVGMDAEEPDLGRFVITNEDKDRGAFKTPTLRNIEQTAPYMHDGSQKTLEEVVEWYAKGGHPNPHLSDKIKKLDLTDQEKKDLVAFMKALTGKFPKVETERLPE